MKFVIHEYYEIYQGEPTPFSFKIIEARDLDEAIEIAEKVYGWGAWAVKAVDSAPLGYESVCICRDCKGCQEYEKYIKR